MNDQDFMVPKRPKSIDYKTVNIEFTFSDSLDSSNYQSFFSIWPLKPVSYTLTYDHKTVNLSNTAPLDDFSRIYLNIDKELKAKNGALFGGFNNFFYTVLDSTPKFPLIPDGQLLTLIKEKTFRYFYDFAHPSCGLARERSTSGDIVTIGGSGFGVMALIVGIERGFITRDDGLTRLNKILGFLETCDRYHGVWPHWLNGVTGKIHPFSANDNGADLVETSFMVQGLITMRQYLDPGIIGEQTLIARIDVLTDAVEYDFFTRGQNAIRFFYYTIGDRLWGDYGFYDAFDPTENWWASSYLAIDQGPIVCMIENHRTGLLWNLFMSSPKVEAGLVKLGFTH